MFGGSVAPSGRAIFWVLFAFLVAGIGLGVVVGWLFF